MHKYLLFLVIILIIGCGGGGSSSTTTTNNNTNDSTNTNTISHGGFSYNIITSPITGKKWLDRHLGASEVCSINRGIVYADFNSVTYASGTLANAAYISSQQNCFGDLYQWGRLTDGHEKINSTTIGTLSIGIIGSGVNFITSSNDWTSTDTVGTSRINQWIKTDGSSICPIGFKVPTLTELSNETIDDSIQDTDTNNDGNIEVTNWDTGFKNFLKLPSSGYRSGTDGVLTQQGEESYIWTTSSLIYLNYGGGSSASSRAIGASVRCIKN